MICLAVCFCFAGSAFGGDKAPLPKKLLQAKTAYVVNNGSWAKSYDKFYAELKKWNRFQLVETKEEADIMIVLSSKVGESGGGVVVGNTAGQPSSGVVISSSESTFFISVTDAKDGTPLWSDYTGEAMLVSNSAKRLVAGLRRRMEEAEREKPPEKKVQ